MLHANNQTTMIIYLIQSKTQEEQISKFPETAQNQLDTIMPRLNSDKQDLFLATFSQTTGSAK